MTRRRITRPTVLIAALATALLALSPVAGSTSPAGTRGAQGGYPDPGPKPTIVLVHGAFADSSGWEAVADRLTDRGYPVLARHQHVHQHDLGKPPLAGQPGQLGERVLAVARLGDHLDPVRALQVRGETTAYHRVVVDHHHTDHVVSRHGPRHASPRAAMLSS